MGTILSVQKTYSHSDDLAGIIVSKVVVVSIIGIGRLSLRGRVPSIQRLIGKAWIVVESVHLVVLLGRLILIA